MNEILDIDLIYYPDIFEDELAYIIKLERLRPPEMIRITDLLENVLG